MYRAAVLPTTGPAGRLLAISRQVLSQGTRDRLGAIYDRRMAAEHAKAGPVGAELIVAQALRELREAVETLTDAVAPADVPGAGDTRPMGALVMDDAVASILNWAQGSNGFAARRGLWFNPPVWLNHAAAGVTVGGANERLVEVPFVHRAMAPLAPDARVLDVGSAESLVPYALASLGYRVTACDPRGYGFAHENLTVAAVGIERLGAPGFDAAICLSSVEHMGLGSYGLETGERGDHQAIQAVRRLLVPDGLLVLTVPFGSPSVDDFQRVYDRAALADLLDGFEVVDQAFYTQSDPIRWSPSTAAELEAASTHGVACVTARRRAG